MILRPFKLAPGLASQRVDLPHDPLPAAAPSKAAKDARQLYSAAQRAGELLTEIDRDRRSAVIAAQEARSALEAEIARGVEAGQPDYAREAELVAAIREASDAADEGVWDHRYVAALQSQQAITRKWQSFMTIHAAELIENDYKPLAEKAWADLEHANAGDSRGALAEAQANYAEVRRLVALLRPFVRQPSYFTVPETGVPLPPVESYAAPAPTGPTDPPVFDPRAVKVHSVAPQLASA